MYATLPTPFGHIVVESDGAAVTNIHLESSPAERHVPRDFPEDILEPFADYFAGRTMNPDIPLNPRGTPFQLAVWRALTTIPPGAPLTYGEMAARVGRPGAARAVGQALRVNPFPIVWPCHRVVAANGLGGFGGASDRSVPDQHARLDIKSWLLAHESRLGKR